MRFVVVGAGAIGGVVGGLLAHHGHDVVAVARGAHGTEIARNGLEIHTPAGSLKADLEVRSSAAGVQVRPTDVVLVAVKSHDTVMVLDEVAATSDPSTPIVCLQNGINNEREALRRFENVYGAIVMCPTVFLEPGHVRAHSAPTTGIIDVGRFPNGSDETAERVVHALAASTFSSETKLDIERWKWAKLVTNLGNAIEAVCGPPARRGPLGGIVRDEAVKVLDAAGIEYASDAEDAARRGDHLQLQTVDGQARPGGSSWQSLQRGTGHIETDYINGEIVMLGRMHGVPTPANERLQILAREFAATGRPPGTVDADSLIRELHGTAGSA